MENDILGTIITVVVPLVVSIAAILQPIIKLNNNIAALTESIHALKEDSSELKRTVDKHTAELSDHEKRIYHIEHKEGGEHE